MKINGPKHLSFSIEKLAKPAFRKRGFTESRIISDWAEIVGPVLGNVSTPSSLWFSKDSKQNGILTIDVYSSSFATEISFLEPQIIEKIATYFGYKAVNKLKIKQKPGLMPKLEEVKSPPPQKPPSAKLIKMVESIEDDDLRNALLSLGQGVVDGDI